METVAPQQVQRPASSPMPATPATADDAAPRPGEKLMVLAFLIAVIAFALIAMTDLVTSFLR